MIIFDYIEIGGIFMWPIFFLFISSFGVFLEKLFYFLYKEMDCTKKFKFNLLQVINKGNSEEIINFCKKYRNSLAQTSLEIIENLMKSKNPEKEVNYIAEEAVLNEVEKLEKGNWILSVTISASPQLGLLGTVIGMIKAFGALKFGSDAPMVATGISEALYTTAFGLMTAIPTLIFLVILNRKIDFILNDLNRIGNLISRVYESKL